MASSRKLRSLTSDFVLHKNAFFEKSLPASAVPRTGMTRSSALTLPSRFVKEHGNKIRGHVILRSQSSTWTVRLEMSVKKYGKRGKKTMSVSVRFCGSGWREFVTFYGLLPGDTLLFSLSRDSLFDVYRKEGESPRKQSTQKMLKYACEDSSFCYSSSSCSSCSS